MTMCRLQYLLPLTFLLGCGGDEQEDDPHAPAREEAGGVTVVRLEGSWYDIGHQHGTLLREELLEGAVWLEDSVFALMEPLAAHYGLLEDAMEWSYPDVVDECQGLVDAVGDEDAWSMDRCMALAYGDVIVEVLGQRGFGCSQLVVSGEATSDGDILHGRNLDWDDLTFIVENPTIFVRSPDDGVPFAVFGFPGNVSPYSGMNAHGISGASNEAHGTAEAGPPGPAHTQMLRRALWDTATLEEAEALFQGEDHASAEILVLGEGQTGAGAAFEMAVDGMAVRRMDSGVVFATNHFVHPDMEGLGEPVEESDSTWSRLMRLEQLLEPGGPESLHGELDLVATVEILRDTTNPVTGETHPPDLFDDGGSLANNAAMQSLVMAPGQGTLYVATGPVPVPQKAYTGFTMDWLLGLTPENEPEPLMVSAAP